MSLSKVIAFFKQSDKTIAAHYQTYLQLADVLKIDPDTADIPVDPPAHFDYDYVDYWRMRTALFTIPLLPSHCLSLDQVRMMRDNMPMSSAMATQLDKIATRLAGNESMEIDGESEFVQGEIGRAHV